MPQDVTSQAIAGSSSVGSPWKVTVSVPPLTGAALASLPPVEAVSFELRAAAGGEAQDEGGQQ